jgi:hypothetical protein
LKKVKAWGERGERGEGHRVVKRRRGRLGSDSDTEGRMATPAISGAAVAALASGKEEVGVRERGEYEVVLPF